MSSRLRQIGRNFVNRLKRFFQLIFLLFVPKRPGMKVALLSIVLVCVFLVGAFAFAAEPEGVFGKIMHLLNYVVYGLCMAAGWVALKIFALVILVSAYNDFVTSKAVTKGWVLIRDICNMFFVLILLLVAFAQILHVEKFSLKKLLPKVIIAAVLVNFSKLICGLIIDFSQVVMMTFVNGYAATAGANLIDGLRLSELLKFSSQSAWEGSSSGEPSPPGTVEIFLALLMGLFVLIMTCIVTFFILVLLLLRIVQLWILVVLSPFAFLLASVPIGGMEKRASEWWQKFGWTAAVGPFMAFFLWLSLLIMSDPAGMFTMDTAAIEAKSKGGAVSSFSLLDNIGQSAIGLAMLMASLMIAQEAGGVVGQAAKSFESKAKSAMKSVGKSYLKVAGAATGVSAVSARAKRVGSAFMAQRKSLKEAKMAKWDEAGKKAFGGYARAVSAVKKAPGALMAGKSAMKESMESQEALEAEAKVRAAGGGAEEQLAARKAGAKEHVKSKVAEYVRNTKRGRFEDMAADAIDQSSRQQALTRGRSLMASREIDTADKRRSALTDERAPMELRKAVADQMSQNGEFTSVEEAMAAMAIMKGDREGTKKMNENLESKQAHLAYAMADEAGKNKIKTKIQSGTLDIEKQDIGAYQNPEFLSMSREALGDKVFGIKMKNIAGRSAKHKEAVRGSVQELAKMEHASNSVDEAELASVDADTTMIPAAKQQRKAELQARLDKRKKESPGLRRTVASVTGNLQQAYGKRGSDGELTKNAAGKVELDPALISELQNHVANLSGKDLAGLDVKEDDTEVIRQLAITVVPQHLAQMATSGEPESIEKVEMIIKQVVTEAGTDPKMEKKMAKIASNDILVGSVADPGVVAALEAAKTPVKAAGATGGGAAPVQNKIISASGMGDKEFKEIVRNRQDGLAQKGGFERIS